jgi:endoglucanase
MTMLRHALPAVVLAMCLTTSGCASSAAPHATTTDADRFLARYVTDDGRVIRHDQGGDIVSEGQAYGMLIAEVAGRGTLAHSIWTWTEQHLQRDDGLLAYHATGSGHVLDSNPAADADVLAAYALLRYQGDDADRLHQAGKRIAGAVLDGEIVDDAGAPVLVAGTWARDTSPPTVNPSYLMPSVLSALGTLTGDDRWAQLASTAVRLVGQLTSGGSTLPTDWAHLAGGKLVPAASPDGSTQPQYGLDAARLPLWFGTACSSDARRLAASWWTHGLAQDDRAAALALSPSGVPMNRAHNALPLMAGAAAAHAAGDDAAERALRGRAEAQGHAVPTYYGDAWLALGAALLDGALDPCEETRNG